MRSTARFVCTTWLVAAVACSDDGLTVQDLNSSSTAGMDTGNGDSSGVPVTTTADSNNPPEDTGSSEGPGTTTGPADSGPDTSTDDGPSTTGGIETGTGTGTGTETGTGTGTTGEACEPITDDPSAIGVDCSGIDCPEGYTCQPFEGFVFQETCQILCTMDCECPLGLSCLETGDKTGAVWFQCGPA